MRKFSTAMGSALPDPVAAEARLSPVPVPAIENKTAPGQRGPVGLSPRTTYSRVNTGTPPVPDAGMSAQKSAPPRGSEFLPNKLAHQEVFMATSADRPSLNDMVKAAMAGTIAKSEITREALRQTGEEFSTKIASAQYSDDHVSTQDVHKLASALGYLAGTFRKEAYDLGPGAGPGSLEVSAPKASGTSLDAGESGHAIASNQPPMTPALQADKVQSGKANTGLEDNMGKKASANFSRLMRMGDEPVETGLPINFIRKLAAEGPDSSASGEGVPSEPGDVTSQKNMIASNMAAINYTKREAKAGAKRDVNKYLDQPALTAAGDAVLARSLEHTNSAGAKIAFSISDAGHTYDQQINSAKANRGYAKQDVKAQRIGSKADLATAKRQRSIDRLQDEADTRTYRSDYKTSRDAARMQLKADKPNLSARRRTYTAAQHAAGDNAYNPLGGMMTKKDGTSSSVGSLFKKNLAMDGSLKSAGVKEMYGTAKGSLGGMYEATKGHLGSAKKSVGEHLERVGDKVRRNQLPNTENDAKINKRIGAGVYAAGALTAGGAAVGGKKLLDSRQDAGDAEAGKTASVDFQKVAAARALLSNLIEKVAEEQGGKKKTKEAVVPLNISSPSDSSGFQAQQLK